MWKSCFSVERGQVTRYKSNKYKIWINVCLDSLIKGKIPESYQFLILLIWQTGLFHDLWTKSVLVLFLKGTPTFSQNASEMEIKRRNFSPLPLLSPSVLADTISELPCWRTRQAEDIFSPFQKKKE